MNILLTNDDGFDAVGIVKLYEELSLEHKVFLVAPKSNCSGMSSAISLRKEIKVETIVVVLVLFSNLSLTNLDSMRN